MSTVPISASSPTAQDGVPSTRAKSPTRASLVFTLPLSEISKAVLKASPHKEDTYMIQAIGRTLGSAHTLAWESYCHKHYRLAKQWASWNLTNSKVAASGSSRTTRAAKTSEPAPHRPRLSYEAIYAERERILRQEEESGRPSPAAIALRKLTEQTTRAQTREHELRIIQSDWHGRGGNGTLDHIIAEGGAFSADSFEHAAETLAKERSKAIKLIEKQQKLIEQLERTSVALEALRDRSERVWGDTTRSDDSSPQDGSSSAGDIVDSIVERISEVSV